MIGAEPMQNLSMTPEPRGPYTVRMLPVEEWDRLRNLPFASQGLPPPELAVIFVAETTAGEIVGIWSAMTAVHLDGLWVDPAHQATTVAGRLLKATKGFLRETGVAVAFTMISDPAVMCLAHKAGFERYPGDLWMIQVPAEEPR